MGGLAKPMEPILSWDPPSLGDLYILLGVNSLVGLSVRNCKSYRRLTWVGSTGLADSFYNVGELTRCIKIC